MTITLKQGDCFKFIADLPNDLVLITDPPYGINLDLTWLSEVHVAKGTKPNKADEKLINDFKPIDITPLLLFKRRLIFGFPYLYDPNATGWIVWDKQPKVAERTIVTPVEVASTTLRKGYDIIRCMWGGYMRDKQISEQRYAHPTQKPLKLMYRIIEKYTKEGDTILDPFIGSGTTGVACQQLNRNFIGYEISPDYFKIAEKRIREAETQRKLNEFEG